MISKLAAAAAGEPRPLGLQPTNMGFLLRFVIASAVLGTACNQERDSANLAGLPPQLVVMPGAERVKPVIRPDGTWQVSYDVTMAFPAAALFDAIKSTLPPDKWEPLANDMLNPDIPSSHKRGWTDFIDGTKNPNTDVRLWMAEWRDCEGNIVWYALRYDSRSRRNSTGPAEPDNDHLSVNAAWYPALIARKMVEQAAKVRSAS